MKQDLTRVYSGSDLSGATNGVIYLPIVRDSTLEAVSVRSDAAQTGDAVFEVRLNGVVITELDALTIADGAKVGSISGLGVDLTDGDEVVLNLISGNVSAPVTFNLATDDGQAGGGGTASLDGFDPYGNFAPISPEAENDEFDGTTLDAKWTIVDSGTANTVSYNERVKSAYYVKSNAGHLRYLEQSFAPGSSDFSLTMCGVCELAEGYNTVGLGVSDASYANLFELQPINNTVSKQIAVHSRAASADTYGIGATIIVEENYPFFYLHIQRTGGNFVAYYSRNGMNWKLLTTYAQTISAISKLYLLFGSNAGTNKTNSVIHWIRRDWLFL